MQTPRTARYQYYLVCTFIKNLAVNRTNPQNQYLVLSLQFKISGIHDFTLLGSCCLNWIDCYPWSLYSCFDCLYFVNWNCLSVVTLGRCSDSTFTANCFYLHLGSTLWDCDHVEMIFPSFWVCLKFANCLWRGLVTPAILSGLLGSFDLGTTFEYWIGCNDFRWPEESYLFILCYLYSFLCYSEINRS